MPLAAFGVAAMLASCKPTNAEERLDKAMSQYRVTTQTAMRSVRNIAAGRRWASRG